NACSHPARRAAWRPGWAGRLAEVGEGYATQQHGGINTSGPGQVESDLSMKTKTHFAFRADVWDGALVMTDTNEQKLLITLVHGTWLRGFLPKFRSSKRSFWFEGDSPFRSQLSSSLNCRDIPHKITPLLWSGANSIFVRDKTAHVLAEHLSAEHAEHPEATQLIIAHSHGGNIALRALYHLQ